ncbi:hypothetical protein AGDE_08429 [Angomonas deanei]|nr:hypothetical protein AGDE_08429 [Angomonas deanei]|eukprot:EPY32946.1 hypothetical protein AGDE_08429 [Angomonas deanei]
MTQSFTHYLIGCTRINSEADVNRAISESTCRAFVVDLKKNKNGQLCTGTCPLLTLLDNIKKNGFTHSTYPIVIFLSPASAPPVDVQDEAAKLIVDTLGTMLAKGMMFEGAAISDPKFSPGALRKKVLIASFQGELKPFVGFLVADMNKDGLGVRVTDIVEGTPAAKGGVIKDDWLTHIGDQPIKNKAHLRECLAKLKVGQEVKVKRENMDELTIVVGGTVDPQDKSVSSALSGIVFFRLTKNLQDNKPWDTVCVDAAKVKSSSLNRTSLAGYFAHVSINGSASNVQELIGDALNAGIQFIDGDLSETCLAFNRGRFYNNGRCGYLLKTSLEGEKYPDLGFDVICGPRAVGCSPMTGGTVKVFGTGSARLSGTRVSVSGYNESSVVVLEMTCEQNGEEHTFIASFSPTLIRQGYRALPCIAQDEEKVVPRRIHGVYLLVNSA